MTTEDLASASLIAVYSAIVVYVLAFIAYTLDLSKRSAMAVEAQDAVAVASGGAGSRRRITDATGASTTVLEKTAVGAAPAPYGPTGAAGAAGAVGASGAEGGAGLPGGRYQRVAFALTIIAWLVHVAAVVLRGIAAERVPWANMFEFAITGTAIIVGVFLAVQLWRDTRFLGTYVTGMVAVLLGLGTVNFYVAISPTPPPLQSAWLVVHVFVAMLGTGAFAIGAGLSVLQLMQFRRANGVEPPRILRFLRTLPSAEVLESLAYRVVVVGFTFWTFTLIAGAIWASRAWGRYWGWDTKEVWTFVIWVIFAGYIHARATRGWRGSRAAYLAIIGFAAVLFNFTIVNLFFKGLHAYSGL